MLGDTFAHDTPGYAVRAEEVDLRVGHDKRKPPGGEHHVGRRQCGFGGRRIGVRLRLSGSSDTDSRSCNRSSGPGAETRLPPADALLAVRFRAAAAFVMMIVIVTHVGMVLLLIHGPFLNRAMFGIVSKMIGVL